MSDTFARELGPEKFARLTRRLGEVNRHIRTRGIQSYRGWMDLLTGYSYNEFFDWDPYFENIYLSYYGISKFCRNNIEVFLDMQLANGFITKQLNNNRPIQHYKPFFAQTALLGVRQTGHTAWLRDKYYNRIKKALDYWFWYMDFDKNGLCVWESSDHSGMDNQEARAGALHSFHCEGVDLNCYLHRELLALATLAGILGHTDDQRRFTAHAQQLAAKINDVCWDEQDGFYYDRNERTGERIRVKSIAGFMPLWSGIAPQDRARRLIKEHLVNPAEFWLPYPVATWAKTEPGYYQERVQIEANWRGPCWANTNYLVMHGLMRYGYRDAARELAFMGLHMALNETDTREFYNSENGIGMGLNPFYGWSTLLYLMPLELELNYDPSDAATETIRPLCTEVLGVAFEG